MPGLGDPRVTLTPRYAAYELSGRTSLSSMNGAQFVSNAGQDVANFGVGERDDDWGGRLHVGDGFSGVELDYQDIDMQSYDVGALTAGYGPLLATDRARARFQMDEWRIGYFGKVFVTEIREGLNAEVALGGVLAHRRMTFDAIEATGVRRQKFTARDDGTPYLAARARVSYRDFALGADYLINPDLHWGGDFEGTMQDVEITLSYRFEDRDVSILGGWRHAQLPSSGFEGPLRFDTDFDLEGFFVGVAFTF